MGLTGLIHCAKRNRDPWNSKKCGPIVRTRADGLCERCGREGHTLHHRKNRSQGGTWEPANVVLLCGDGTQLCHGWVTTHPTKAHEEGFHVKSWEDPAEVPILLHLRVSTRLTNESTAYAEQVDMQDPWSSN